MKYQLCRTKNLLYLFLNGTDFQKTRRKVWASLLAIIIGVLISFIVIGASNADPLLFYKSVFRLSFNKLLIGSTMNYYAVYILGGLAIAIGFRVGFFNIGVPGQMYMSGMLIYLLGISVTNYKDGMIVGASMNNGVFMLLAFIIAVLAGTLVCMFSGILKAFFNVNEVVTSIMMNYSIYYLAKWVFSSANKNFWNPAQGGSRDFISNQNGLTGFIVDGNTYLIPLLLALIVGIIAIIGIRYTTFGYKLRAIGFQKTASRYAGIKIKSILIRASMISGALAGIMGFVYYLAVNQSMSFLQNGLIDATGFNTIGVSLLAFDDPVGVLAIALFWASLENGAKLAAGNPLVLISNGIANIIFGVVVYLASISIVLYRLRIFGWCRNWALWRFHPGYLAEYKRLKSQIKTARQNMKQLKPELKKNRAILNQALKNKTPLVDNQTWLKYRQYRAEINNAKQTIIFNRRLAWEKLVIGQKWLIIQEFHQAKFRLIANMNNAHNQIKSEIKRIDSKIKQLTKNQSIFKNVDNNEAKLRVKNIEEKLMLKKLAREQLINSFNDSRKMFNHNQKQNLKTLKLNKKISLKKINKVLPVGV